MRPADLVYAPQAEAQTLASRAATCAAVTERLTWARKREWLARTPLIRGLDHLGNCWPASSGIAVTIGATDDWAVRPPPSSTR